MSFQDAIKVLRKAKPNRLIWYGFEYKDSYVFAVAADMQYVAGDGALTWYSVNKQSKAVEFFDYCGRSLFDGEYDILDAAKSRVVVDITQEQLES